MTPGPWKSKQFDDGITDTLVSRPAPQHLDRGFWFSIHNVCQRIPWSSTFMPKKNVGSSPDASAALEPVRKIFRAFVCTVVPEAMALDMSAWRELEKLVNDALRDRPASLHRQLRLFLRAIEWLPALRFGRFFTALDASRRTRVLRYLQDHRLELVRTGFWGLRTLALLGYYGRAEAAREIGYRTDRRGWEAVQ